MTINDLLDIIGAGKHDVRFDHAARETEFIPGRHHATHVVEAVVGLS